MRNSWLLVLAASLLAGCDATPTSLALDGGVFAATIDGHVGLTSSTVTDVDTIDLHSSLDLGQTRYVPYVRADLQSGSFDLSANAFKTTQHGEGVVTADFGNITAGSTVKSKLDLTIAQGRLVYDVVESDHVRAGLGLAVDWFDLSLVEREQTFGLTESIDLRDPVPLVAARLAVNLPVVPLRVDVDAAAMKAHVKDVDGTIVDADALLRYERGHLGLFAGYRYVRLDVDGTSGSQRFAGVTTISGWLAGLSVRF